MAQQALGGGGVDVPEVLDEAPGRPVAPGGGHAVVLEGGDDGELR